MNVAQIEQKTPNNIFEWIFLAKGIGILLVVIGHYYSNTAPAYWNGVVDIIYKFHMPLFFILSGLLFNPTKYSYHQLILNKLKRLLYPFVSIALIFFLIKYSAAHFVDLDHPVSWSSIVNLALNPVHSYMPLLWFVYTLFFMFLIYPLLLKIFRNNILIISILIIINSLGSFGLQGMNLVILYSPFFLVGIIMRENPNFQLTINKPVTLLVLPMFFFSLFYFFHSNETTPYVIRFLLGVSGSFVIIGLSKWIAKQNQFRLPKFTLAKIGIFSMSIYFFHPLFESFVRILFSQTIQTNLPFELIAILAISAGTLFPLIAEIYIFRKYHFTRRYLLGLSK